MPSTEHKGVLGADRVELQHIKVQLAHMFWCRVSALIIGQCGRPTVRRATLSDEQQTVALQIWRHKRLKITAVPAGLLLSHKVADGVAVRG